MSVLVSRRPKQHHCRRPKQHHCRNKACQDDRCVHQCREYSAGALVAVTQYRTGGASFGERQCDTNNTNFDGVIQHQLLQKEFSPATTPTLSPVSLQFMHALERRFREWPWLPHRKEPLSNLSPPAPSFAGFWFVLHNKYKGGSSTYFGGGFSRQKRGPTAPRICRLTADFFLCIYVDQ